MASSVNTSINTSINTIIPIEDEFVVLSDSGVLREKNWAAGSREHNTSLEYVALDDGTARPHIKLQNIKYPPALITMLNELIVNAVDHFIKSENTTKMVNTINIRFIKNANDPDAGEFSIENNGNGVRVDWHPVSKMWTPHMIFGQRDRGSNMKKSVDSITGGTNGLGTKVVNAHSTKFAVETVFESDETKIYYQQSWESLERPSDPLIIDLNIDRRLIAVSAVSPTTTHIYKKITNTDKTETYICYYSEVKNIKESNYKNITTKMRIPHSTFTCAPDYKIFNYTELNQSDLDLINNILLTLAIKASAYVGSKCAVSYNGVKLKYNSMTDIVKLSIFASIDDKNIFTTMITPENKHPWEVCCVITNISDTFADINYDDMQNVNQISIVNGVTVLRGTHLKHLRAQITAGVKEMNEKNKNTITIKQSHIDSNLFLSAVVKIGGVSWDAQAKKEMQIEASKLRMYKLDESFINKVCRVLYDKVLESTYREQDNKAPARVQRVRNLVLDKLDDALFAGDPKRSLDCTLMLTEGDSAKALCVSARTYNIKGKYVLGPELFGVYPLKGVPPNVRKHINIKYVCGKKRITINKQLTENEVWTNLLKITGLNIDHIYDKNSPNYDKEIKTLRYGRILACVDQDLDGKGNIFPLLYNMFVVFWPALAASGYIQRYNTPVKRAFKKTNTKTNKEILDFYTIAEFNLWKTSADMSKYEVTHYKGLGGHEKERHPKMFEDFYKNIIKYSYDDESEKYFNIYYGKDADLRKIQLIADNVELTPAEEIKFKNEQCMPINKCLLTDANDFQNDNIQRKLWSAIDGMNEGGRKILFAAFETFLPHNKKQVVSVFAGNVKAITNYEHGEPSLYSSIIGKAFITTGGLQLPLLLPKGEFGSRLCGGKSHASPRYINTKLNIELTQLLYNKYDNHLLKSRLGDDDNPIEPVYYVPILPTAVLEHVEMPAHGWKIALYGRNVFDVIANIRMMINYPNGVLPEVTDPNFKLLPMKMNMYGSRSYNKYIGNVLYNFGRYEYDKKNNNIIITELPIREWTENYKSKLNNKLYPDDKDLEKRAEKAKISSEIFYNINCISDCNTVKIIINLVPNGINKLEEYADAYIDGVEKYFELYKPLHEQINLLSYDEKVIEFKSYDDIIKYWFPYRVSLYTRRYSRLIIIAELDIKLATEIIRYIEHYREMGLIDIPEESAIEILKKNNFRAINTSASNYFSSIQTDQLEAEFYGEKANFNYLLDITDRQKLKKSLEQRKHSLEKMLAEYEPMKANMHRGNFIGAYYWLAELDEIEKVIKNGIPNMWSDE